MEVTGGEYYKSFKQGMPAYILDLNYKLLDWNDLFEFLFGDQLSLEKGIQMIEFVTIWKNSQECLERSLEVFGLGAEIPKIDIEDAYIPHPKYGDLHLKKFATQVFQEGKHVSWLVQYNICSVEKEQLFWEDANSIPIQ